MNLPKVKKKLSDLFPTPDELARKTKQVGLGILMVTIGAFAPPPVQSASPAIESPAVASRKDAPESPRLILQQPSDPTIQIQQAQHYSHWSHYSHSSHYSHYSHHSHYSSRY